MCDILKEIYRGIYEESFDFSCLDDRIKLQKAVYLLENMGVYVGGYSFKWDKYGAYSFRLDGDAQRCSADMSEKVIEFSEAAKAAFDHIKEILSARIVYDCTRWMECIVSLHYLINIQRFDEDNVLDELRFRKDYLNDAAANQKALSIVRGLITG